ncbi:MAG: alpha-mannosidase [Rariglobus sp.]|jgi:predicted alpha-1,2-mannosidase|nr:alpha-mannosidase [Rariglobus sp.]
MSDLTALVEPRLGNTIGRWISFAAACRPLGLVALSPDTRIGGNGDWGCGYNLADHEIVGFSHVHDWQSGGVLVMPVTGDVPATAGPEGFKSPFSRDTELCKPGYHRVHLDRYHITAELTATPRAGIHRYTFPPAQDAALLLDLASQCGPCAMLSASLKQLDARTFEGHVVNGPTLRKPKNHTVHFVLTLDTDASLSPFDPSRVQARLSLGRPAAPVTVKVGISYTSIAAAHTNLQAETAGKSFAILHREAHDDWNNQLAYIVVEGGDPTRRARFYTDLYFSLLGRRTVSDVAGTYFDNTGPSPRIRQIPLNADGRPRYRHFSSDAFWGAQWSLVPLWALVYPELIDEFCHSFMDMYRNGGLIPRGPTGGADTFVMTSAQTTPLFACALNNTLHRPSDLEEVYQAVRKNHFSGGLMSKAGYEHDTCKGGGIEDYIALGYIPEDLPPAGFHTHGAAQTIEHAYNDWALAQLASALGHTDDAELFTKRSRNYRNLFDRSVGFCRPRERDGSWTEPFDPSQKKGWTEANAWTFTYHSAHDVPGLIECFGSRDAFVARLEEAFVLSEQQKFFAPRDHHNLIPLDFGNEPALATAHLFQLAGRPDRTQFWLRRVIDTIKAGNSPEDTWGGDEDQGIMGAWNVLVSIGLFSATGACEKPARYQLTAPLFDRVTIALPAGRTLVITTSGLNPSVTNYTESVTFNGAPLSTLELPLTALVAGGELHVILSPAPAGLTA